MNDQYLRDILNELKAFNRNSGMNRFGPERNDPNEGFYRDGQGESGDPMERMRKRVEAFNKQIDRGNKTLKDLEGSQKKMFKSMLEGVPIFGRVYKSLKKSADTIDEITQGQSKAYRESAKAAGEFAGSASTSAEDLKKVNSKLHEVYESTQRISKVSKNKEEMERKILSAFKKTSLESESIASDFSNVSELIEKVRKERQQASGGTKASLDKALENLEALEIIPQEVDRLKKSMSDADFAKILENNPKLAKLFKDIKGALSSDSNEEVVDKLGDLDDTGDRLAGVMDALGITMRDSIDVQRQFQKDFREAMGDLGKAISAALGEAIVKESIMTMTRQRLTGAPMGYAARLRAGEMGMSETEALTSLAENRYLFRRIARDTGLATGAGDLLQSGNLNELRTLSREMGLVGKEALDNLVAVGEDLRVLGSDLSQRNLSGMVGFIRDSFKDLGLTQEQMRQFFGEMSREGMMATMTAGPTGRFAGLEVMQEEIKYRGQLARVLNQELEIQKKRVQEMTQSAYGSPAEAIRKSVGMEILAQTTGMSRTDQRLLSELARTGGRSMNAGDRRRAIRAREQLGLNVGQRLDEAARGDQIGQRAFLTQMLSMGGIDAMEAVRAYQRNRGTVIGGPGLARTENPAYETNDLLNKAVSAFEYGQGVLKSAVGNSTAAIVSAIGSAATAIVASNLVAGQGMGGLRSMGRGALRGAKTIGKFALRGGAAGLAAYGVNRATEGTRFSALGPTATGAAIGSMIPGVGTALGAGAGATLGFLSGASADPESNRERLNRIARVDQTIGRFGAENMSGTNAEMARLRKNLEDARASYDGQRIIQAKKELTEASLTNDQLIRGSSLGENMFRLREIQRMRGEDETISRGRGMHGFSDEAKAKMLEYDRMTDPVIDAISEDVVAASTAGELKKITDKETLRNFQTIIRQDEDIQGEERNKLLEKLQTLIDRTDEEIAAIEEGNQQEAAHYGEMSESALREQINARLTGISSMAMNRSFGGANEHSR